MDVIGGGVLMAAAAVLWVAYLLPTWLRRRQYLATERNAARLGQTIRIIAETSETPEPVQLGVTAREVAAQQRILAEQEATARLEAEAAEQRAIAERIAAEQAAREARELAMRALATQPIEVVPATATATDAPAPDVTSDRASSALTDRLRLRRRRGRRSLVLLVSMLVLVVGLIGLAAGWPPIAAGIGAVGVVAAIAELARLGRSSRSSVHVVPAAVPVVESEPFEPIEVELDEAPAEWTPQPLPRPLTLSRGTIAAAAMASIEAAEDLRRAHLEAELAERAAELQPEPPRLQPKQPVEAPRPAAARDEAANPYARMGIVGETAPGIDDLDAVLRRRRQAV